MTDGASAVAETHELLADLNPPQREAVIHGEGALCILAGPGSGKTRVITRRIAWLITERGVAPGEILAITFTNKAAREMKERVERLLPGDRARGLWIGTFHATCARILRRDIELLGGWTRDFTIYDTHDRNQIVKDLLKKAGYDLTRFRPSMVGGWISDWKNRGFRPEAAVQGAEASAADEDGPSGADGIETEVFRRIRRSYEDAMRANNALDFDDLLLRVLELFERHRGVRDAYASRFRFVMVDEYQDTNRVQYLLTRHLASWHQNLAVCGDPDQSIYAWRGADLRNILSFEEDFGSPVVVKLEQNYRSCGNVLAAAQAVIGHNRERKEKELWTDRGPGELLAVLECGDENDEAREIADQIRGLRTKGVDLAQVAVFYRVNFMQRALETQLRLAGVPYQVVGGVEFYERREIRDLVAYLKLIVNPADDVAFQRVANVPSRGIGERSLETLAEWADDRRLPLSQAVRSKEALARIRGRARAGLEAFGDLLAALAPLREQPASLALETVLEEIDADRWLAQLEEEGGLDRRANVDELRAHAEEYARLNPEGLLRGFLQDVALVSDVDGLAEEQGKVTLMTLHSAKGLEFRRVFLAGCEEELLPHVRSITDEGGEEGAGVEEERRLFYVGLTRAMDRAVLTWARVRLHFGQQSFRARSRFLDEIPEELVEGVEDDASPGAGRRSALGAYEPADDVPALAVGDRVEHDHFGGGTVERLSGSGVNARATVDFVRHGRKELLLQYAKLRVVGRGRS